MEELTIIPNSLSEAEFLALTFFSLVTSMITASLGIGGGTLMLATMAQLLPIKAIVPVHGAVQLGSNGGRAILMFRDIQSQPLIWFFVGSTIGAAAGGTLVVELPTQALKIALGSFILISIWLPTLGYSAPSDKTMLGVGFFSTLLTMFVGATGPFVIAVLRAFGFSPITLVSTSAAAMVIQHCLKVAAFGVLGFAFEDYAILILLMIMTGFIGTFIGRKILISLGRNAFQKGLNILLALLGMRLIYSGLTPH